MSSGNEKICCVPNCGKTRKDNTLHQFPNPDKDQDRFRTWLYAIGGNILALDNNVIFKNRRVCHAHFGPQYHTRNAKLSAIAVPTLHLPGYYNTEERTPMDNTRKTCEMNMSETSEAKISTAKDKTSTEFQQIEARLQGETHKDHTYVTDKTITLPVGTETLEKRIDDIDVNPDDAKDATQIEVPPDIEPVPEIEETFDPDYEVQPVQQSSPSPLPEVEDSAGDSVGEAVFSWQREEEVIEADEPEEPPAPPADPTLALYCDPDPDDPKANADPDPDVVFDPQPDQAVPSVPAPVDNRCKDCKEINGGFDFWCVQCAGGALCGACAGRAPHHAHYVLRAPMGCSRARTQAVLTMIRQQAVLISISQQLQNQNLSQHGTVDDDLKLEVKEEPAEPPPAASLAAEPDPLACEPISLYEPEFIQPQEPVSLRSPISLHSPHSPISLHSRPDSPHSPISLHSRPDSPHSPLHSPISVNTRPDSPHSPLHSPISVNSRPDSPHSPLHSPISVNSRPDSPHSPLHSPISVNTRPDSPHSPLHSPISVNSRPDSPHSPLHSPISVNSRPDSPHSPLHSPISVNTRPDSPHSPLHSRPDSPLSPHAPQEADKTIAEKIVEHHEPLQPPRLRKPTDAHEEILSIPTQRKLVKVSPAEVKRAFLSHIERVVTTQTKQLKVYQPHLKLASQVRENVVATKHREPYEGNSRTTRLQVRGSQEPLKVTSKPKPSETVTIDLDIADETVEYLEEGLESDIETVDNVDNYEDDVFDDDVLDEDYILDDDDLEDDLSDEERIVPNVPGRGIKRKKDAEETLPVRKKDAKETLPVKGPSESMARALPSKAVIQVRPLTSLEIRNWTADRKRLRKD